MREKKRKKWNPKFEYKFRQKNRGFYLKLNLSSNSYKITHKTHPNIYISWENIWVKWKMGGKNELTKNPNSSLW